MAFNPPIVDNFTGSDGSINNRVSSTGPVWAAPAASDTTAAAIASNAIPSNAAGARDAVIDSLTYGPDLEVACTITQLGSGGQIILTVYSNGYSSFPYTLGDGRLYHLALLIPGDGGFAQFTLTRETGGVGVDVLDGVTWAGGTCTAPESFGMSLVEEATGTRITMYRKLAGVWTADPTDYLDTDASRPSGQRYAGFEAREVGGNTVIMDDFMVGTTGGVPVAWYGAAG